MGHQGVNQTQKSTKGAWGLVLKNEVVEKAKEA